LPSGREPPDNVEGTPPKIVGTGLKDLAGLTDLRALDFVCSAEFTAEGLTIVKQFSKLQQLRLIGAPRIADAALKDLNVLTDLQELVLRHTAVTDPGLAHLKKLTGLRILYLKPMPQIRFT
jgi:hypothetical protein